MPNDDDTLTPQERLAISRHALLAQWGALPPLDYADEDGDFATHPHQMAAHDPDPGGARGFPWKLVVQDTARRWWRRHPANAAGVLLRPLIERHAREHPGQLVVTSAALGAIVVLAKPWRLLSLTAVAAALLKSSDVADVVTTLMRRPSPSRKETP